MTCGCGCGVVVERRSKSGPHPKYLVGHQPKPHRSPESIARQSKIPRVCVVCGVDFKARKGNVERGWGLCCGKACRVAHTAACNNARATPMTIRQLQPGQALPSGHPRRYKNDRGYVRLRWLIGPQTYVETYEHRVVAGVVQRDLDVHHINGIKDDNRPDNLRQLTRSEHARLHAAEKHGIESAPMREMEDE